MKRWEYKTTILREMFNSNDFHTNGDDGWELVSVVPCMSISGYKAVFKREKSE